MESSSRQQELLTKFSHSNYVLRYFGSYIEGRHLMNQLCTSTRDHWKSNIKGYRYGLRKFARNYVLEINYPSENRALEYVNEHKLYTQFDLRITIGNEFDQKDVLTFLESATEHDALQFDKIFVPDKFYSHTPELVNELFDALTKGQISGTCIKTVNAVEELKTIPNKIKWLAKYNMELNWSDLKRVGGVKMNFFYMDISSLHQTYKEYNLPTKALEFNPFFLPEVFHEFEFNKLVKNSLKKIIVVGSNIDKIYTQFDILKKFKEFPNIESFGYKSIPSSALEELGEYLGSALEVSSKFSFVMDISNPTFEMLNTHVYVKSKDSLIGFKGEKLQFVDINLAEESMKFDEDGIHITNKISMNFVDIHNIQFRTQDEIKNIPQLYAFYRSGHIGINSTPISFLRLDHKNFKIFDQPNVPPIEYLVIDFKHHSYEHDKRQRFYDFIGRVVLGNEWSVKKFIMNVVIMRVSGLRDKQYSEHVYKVLKLPISELMVYGMKDEFNQVSKQEMDEFYQTITTIKSLKTLVFRPNAWSKDEFDLRNLDLSTPNIEGEERVKKGVYNILYNFKFINEHRHAKDDFKIVKRD